MRKSYLILATATITVLLVAVGIEVIANALYYAKHAKVFYFDARQPTQAGAYTAAEAVFHPYYSYIHRVGRSGGWWTTNNMGFQLLTKLVEAEPGCCDYPMLRREGEILVGVFGGSAAGGFALAAQASPEFAEQLARIPAWSGKRVRILNFAMPGFKQPQQLLTLAYYLSLGQHFDLVLNIDGFNEVVTSHRNWSSGTEPSFPADTLWGEWGRQLEKRTLALEEGTSEQYLAAYYRAVAKNRRLSANKCRLAACYAADNAIANLSAARAEKLESGARKAEEKTTLFPTAIHSVLEKNFDIFSYTAEQWAASSKAMADLVRPTGALYLHVMQPNQWWKAAGNYQPIEKDHIYKWVIDLINNGYPKLVSRVPALAASGVAILDATNVFRSLPWREVYIDDCCHYTDKGNALLGAKIAERVNGLLSVDGAISVH